MNTELLKKVFDEHIVVGEKIYNGVVESISSNKNYFYYLNNKGWETVAEKGGIAALNYYGTIDTLQRIFIGCVTGYLRMYKWIQGIELGLSTNNYLVFSSSARGFLEATTDYYDAIENIPLTIAENYKMFKEALSKEKTDMLLGFKHIDNLLLHFQEASRKDNGSNPLFKPKNAKSYMENPNLKYLNLYDFYGELCETTHPAKASLYTFKEENYRYSLDVEMDAVLINELLDKHANQLSRLLELTENLFVATIKVVNSFGIKELQIEYMDCVSLSEVRIWDRISKCIS